jgi:hypothetical protein
VKSLVDILFINRVACSVASYKCHLFNDLSGFNTEYLGNCFCSLITTGYTEIVFISLTVCQSFCIRITSAVTACSAVDTRKGVSNGVLTLVKPEKSSAVFLVEFSL